MLGFFFRHYEPLVSRFVIYDERIDDETLAMLRGRPNVEVRPFPNSGPEFVCPFREGAAGPVLEGKPRPGGLGDHYRD